MAEDKQRENLGRAIAEPMTLAQERAINSFLAEEPVGAETSEGNLLTLKTLRTFYPDGDESKAIAATAREESRYLLPAMIALNNPSNPAYSLGTKYGRDLRGANEFAKYLKARADEEELRLKTLSTVGSIVVGRAAAKGMYKSADEAKAALTKAGIPFA
jgi:hypothetical protein